MGFRIEACFEDRSEQVQAFATGAMAAEALVKYNSGVRMKADKCGPVFWRLSVYDSLLGHWHEIAKREREGQCKALLDIIRNAVKQEA